MDARHIVRHAVGPALAADRKNRVVASNQEARDLLGLSQPELTGKPLYELVDARDTFDNRLAEHPIPFFELVSRGEPVNRFEISMRKGSGDQIRVSVSIVVVLGPKGNDYEVVYLLRPIYRRRRADEAVERILAGSLNGSRLLDRVDKGGPVEVPDLTRRQIEVLGLLAKGESAAEIAAALGISVTTVRSHIRDVLKRMGVHSQVEAVARAFRDRLI